MRWAWHLGRPFGIDVYIHATFAFLLLWVGINAYAATGTLAGAAGGIVFIILVFGTVVLHELGHALTARRFGIASRDITLLPIAGVARLERMPEKPAQEQKAAVRPRIDVSMLVGSWTKEEADEFDAYLKEMRRIDPEMWK